MNGEMAPPSAAPHQKRRWGVAILIALATSTFAWLVATESGLQALIGAAERFSGGTLRIEGIEGTLHGSFSAMRLVLDLPTAKIELSGLVCDWQPSALFVRKLAITRLRVAQADIFLRESPPSSEPLALPESLRLPLDIDFNVLEIERLKLVGHGADTSGENNIAPLLVLSEGRLSLVGDAARFHLRQLTATLPQGQVEIEAELGTSAPYALHASARLESEEFSVQLDGKGSLAEPLLTLQAQGRGAQAQVTLIATPFEALPLKMLKLDAEKVNPAAFLSNLPHAELRLLADLSADVAGSEPVLRGPVQIDNAKATTLDANGLPISTLHMEASINAALDELRLDALQLDGGGGKLLGWLLWRKDETDQTEATVPVGFGRLKANLEAQGIDPSRLDGRLPSRRVDARLEMDAVEARQQGKLSLSTGEMQLEAEGEIVASAVGRPVFVLNLDLHNFNPAAFHPASPPASIKLHAALSGTLIEKPAIAVHYKFGESRFNGRLLTGSGLFTWDGMRVRNADLMFDIAENRLKLTGAWGEIQDRLVLDIDAPRLADIGFGLGGRLRASSSITGALEAPAGTLKVNAEKLHLPDVLEISSLTGEARIEAGASGLLALSLTASGLAAGDARFATINLTADGKRDRHQIQAKADGKLDKDLFALKTTLEGNLHEARWQGRITTLENTGHWPLRLRAPAAMVVGFAPEEFSLLDAEFDVDLVSATQSSSRSRSRSANTNTATRSEPGRISLIETRWQNGAAILRGKLTGFPATRIPGLERSGQRSPLMLGADWDLRLSDSIEGQVRLFRESGDFSVRGEISTRLGLERFEAYLFARQQKVKLVLATHGREVGELGILLEAGVERAGQGWRLAPHAPLSGVAHFDMPSLAWLGRLSRENIEISGSLAGDITLSGTSETPDLQGRIKGRALQLSFIDQGLMLAGGQLEAGFSHRSGRQSLRLDKLEFESPNRVKPADKRLPVDELTATPGRLLITGDIDLGAKAQEAQRGRFEFTADRLPLLQRPDRWLVVSGKGQAGLQGMALDVQAQLRADAGYIAIDDMPPPSLGDDVLVRSEETNESSEGSEGIAIAGNVSVDLGRALYLSAFGVDTRLVGKLDVGLRPFEPARVLGVIRTIGGTWRGYGQYLKIERGSITFQGDATNPAVNITAMRRGLEVEAGVMITGDVRRPQVKLVSEPAVPEHEKLSWLILGRAPDAGGSDMALLLPAAQALFGSTGGGMTDDIGSKLGFDTFTIGQGELNSMRRNATSRVVGGGSRIDAGPMTESEVVTVGKQLTNDLSLSFEQSLGGAESLVKLTYRVSRELSLIARGGTDNALDLYYTRVFRNREWQQREKARKKERERTSGATSTGE